MQSSGGGKWSHLIFCERELAGFTVILSGEPMETVLLRVRNKVGTPFHIAVKLIGCNCAG